jgi:ribosomal protein S18 acetylase RimI-like enzyme
MADETVSSSRGELTIHGPILGLGTRCAPILRALPQWFGIESGTLHYIKAIDDLPTFTATLNGEFAGFLTLKQHFAHAAEIYVMGVDARFHRQGCGRALLAAAETYLRQQGVEYIQVKTLSPSHPDPNYALTRKFYAAVGFRSLEEFPTLWNEANPCLLLVKWLG